MIRLEISSGGGLVSLTAVLLAVSAIQGCSINSGLPDSAIQNRLDAWGAIKSEKPRPMPIPNVHVGAASWYGPGFNGKKTASGDIFDERKFTAAHKTIPLGTKAKVTHVNNGKSVEVLINDRGPYVEGRMIDLSHAAAKALGMVDNGIAEVQVELVQEEVLAENAPTIDRHNQEISR